MDDVEKDIARIWRTKARNRVKWKAFVREAKVHFDVLIMTMIMKLT